MSRRYQVVVTDFMADAMEPEREVLGEIADVVALDAHSESDLDGRFEEADAVIVYHLLTLHGPTIARLKDCKLILCCGVGYDNVDYAFARRRGIPVANLPDYGTEEVADSAIGMMLALTRGIALFNSRMRDGLGEWDHNHAVPLFRLRGRVMGIIGLGRIGTAAALRAKSLGMEVVFYDPYVPDGRDKSLGVRRVETLDELLGQSYVLTLHCPLTDETNHMIDAGAIAKLPRGSYVVNTARGAAVDTSAIPDAIASGQLAGAAIDVLEREPPPPDDPLIAAWRDPQHPAYHRVIVNPHAAFYCEEGAYYMRSRGAEICRRALLGLPIRTIVN